MKGIKKYFYGVKALDGVDFQVRTTYAHNSMNHLLLQPH